MAMRQTLGVQELFRHLKKDDLKQYDTDKEYLGQDIESMIDRIVKDEFTFSLFKRKDYVVLESLPDTLLLRPIDEIIKKRYKVKNGNRDRIVSQIISLLNESTPKFIVRGDISKFFQTVNYEIILDKFREDGFVSYQHQALIKQLLHSATNLGANGLPIGLSISSTFAEIYLRKFDRIITRNESVYFYARFVDDFIIFLTDGKIANQMKSELQEYLPANLSINESKTIVFDDKFIADHGFDFLGYNFKYVNNTKGRQLKVAISRKKINRTKTRIVRSFLSYFVRPDFSLLKDRILFLSRNYTIKSNQNGRRLSAGIFYNYMRLTDTTSIAEINDFYRNILNASAGRFGMKLRSKLDESNRQKLSKISFLFGYNNKVKISLDPQRIVQIKSCWR